MMASLAALIRSRSSNPTHQRHGPLPIVWGSGRRLRFQNKFRSNRCHGDPFPAFPSWISLLPLMTEGIPRQADATVLCHSKPHLDSNERPSAQASACASSRADRNSRSLCVSCASALRTLHMRAIMQMIASWPIIINFLPIHFSFILVSCQAFSLPSIIPTRNYRYYYLYLCSLCLSFRTFYSPGCCFDFLDARFLLAFPERKRWRFKKGSHFLASWDFAFTSRPARRMPLPTHLQS